MSAWANTVVVGAALLVGFAALRGRPATAAPARTATTAPSLVVPAVDGVVALDGELGDGVWRNAVGRTGAFREVSGEAARPYSDARLVVVRDELVVALYAADEDVRTRGPLRDVFRVTIGDVTFEVSATGELRGAPPGTRIGHDLDGTPDDPSDDDEEWVIELAIPLASLAPATRGEHGERMAFAVERCETTRSGARSCSSVHRELVLPGKH